MSTASWAPKSKDPDHATNKVGKGFVKPCYKYSAIDDVNFKTWQWAAQSLRLRYRSAKHIFRFDVTADVNFALFVPDPYNAWLEACQLWLRDKRPVEAKGVIQSPTCFTFVWQEGFYRGTSRRQQFNYIKRLTVYNKQVQMIRKGMGHRTIDNGIIRFYGQSDPDFLDVAQSLQLQTDGHTSYEIKYYFHSKEEEKSFSASTGTRLEPTW